MKIIVGDETRFGEEIHAELIEFLQFLYRMIPLPIVEEVKTNKGWFGMEKVKGWEACFTIPASQMTVRVSETEEGKVAVCMEITGSNWGAISVDEDFDQAMRRCRAGMKDVFSHRIDLSASQLRAQIKKCIAVRGRRLRAFRDGWTEVEDALEVEDAEVEVL